MKQEDYSEDSNSNINFLADTTPYPLNIEISKAEGSYLYTADNKKILDFISGIAVSNIGHRHPNVIKALEKQMNSHLHTMVYGEFIQNTQREYAELLIKNLPNNFEKVYFTNSGTEANEGALKLAKRFTGRTEIISFKKSYHGSTHGSLSVSGNEMRKQAFRPLLPDVKFLEFNNLDDLDEITSKTACVIMESIQGDAGVIIPSDAFINRLKNKCKSTGTLIIFDEVQSGIGRTGKLFAFEHFDIVPDIITCGKALGGGLPLGAFCSSKEIMDSLTYNPSLGHITTYGGNPMCCAAGLATLKTIIDEDILSKVNEKGQLIEDMLRKSTEVVEVRRKGLMIGVQLKTPEIVEKLVEHCLKDGVLLFWFLSTPNSFRIAPPLNISNEDINFGCETILSCLKC